MTGHTLDRSPCDDGRHYDCPGCTCTCHAPAGYRRVEWVDGRWKPIVVGEEVE